MATKSEEVNKAEPVEQFIAELKGFLQEHHPKSSKMIQSILKGTASKSALQKFAKEFYAYSAFSVRPFAALVANAPDETSFRLMLQNWLKAFHVRFWSDLLPYLGTLETKGLVRLQVTPIYKRYAFIARLEKV